MVFIPNPLRSRHLQELDRVQFEKEKEAYNYRVQTVCAYWCLLFIIILFVYYYFFMHNEHLRGTLAISI